ncbi:MAG: YbhN family protein [Gaiella sp.]|nr:YbhN family protein [Gaiella sp.]
MVALLLAVGVALLIARAAGFARVKDVIATADPSWFAVCLVAEIVAFAAYAVVLEHAFGWRGGPTVGLRLSLHVTLASLGATRIIAAAGAGGLAVTYWSFRRAGHATDEAIVRVLGLNTLVYLVFGAAAWVAALLAALGLHGGAPLAITLPWLVLVPACVVAARSVTDARRVRRLTARQGSFLRRALGYAIAGAAWVRDVLRDRSARAPLAGAAGYWAGDALCLWAALHAVGEPLPPAVLVLAYATGYAAMILPLPLGGVGGVEAAMTYALTAVGVPLAAALVAVAVYRLFGFWIPTIPALGALAFLPRAGRALEREAGGVS